MENQNGNISDQLLPSLPFLLDDVFNMRPIPLVDEPKCASSKFQYIPDNTIGDDDVFGPIFEQPYDLQPDPFSTGEAGTSLEEITDDFSSPPWLDDNRPAASLPPLPPVSVSPTVITPTPLLATGDGAARLTAGTPPFFASPSEFGTGTAGVLATLPPPPPEISGTNVLNYGHGYGRESLPSPPLAMSDTNVLNYGYSYGCYSGFHGCGHLQKNTADAAKTGITMRLTRPRMPLRYGWGRHLRTTSDATVGGGNVVTHAPSNNYLPLYSAAAQTVPVTVTAPSRLIGDATTTVTVAKPPRNPKRGRPPRKNVNTPEAAAATVPLPEAEKEGSNGRDGRTSKAAGRKRGRKSEISREKDTLRNAREKGSKRKFKPSLIIVQQNEDVSEKIRSFAEEKGSIVVLGIDGTLSTVQLLLGEKITTLKGNFQILSLLGSVILGGERGSRNRGGFAISFAKDDDGEIIGGRVMGEMVAASTVEIHCGSLT